MANSDTSVPPVDHQQEPSTSLSTTFSIYGLAAVSITYLRSILAPILGHQMEHVSKIDRRTTKHGARFRITVPEDRQRNIIQRLKRQSKQTHWRIRQNYRRRRPHQLRPTAPPPPLSRQILAVNVANISNKRPAIRHIVRNTRLWAISETCITSSKLRFTVPGFDVIQHPATGPGRRGIALGIPSCFGGHEHGSAVGTMILAKVPNFTPECLWIVGSVYVGHSGATTNYSRREAFASIRQALDRVVPFDNNYPVLIFGDWNTDPQRLRRIVHSWGHGLDNIGPHKLSISIATDWGFLQRVHKFRGKGAPLGELDKVKNVLLEIEFMVGLTRAMLLAQFNVLVEIQRVVVGGKDSEFLHQAKSAGTCQETVSETHRQFHQWTRESAPESRMWFLLTDCHGDQGAGFVGGAGALDQNTAVVSHQSGHAWLHFAKQFGHSLGLNRALFLGNNNRQVDSSVQFHVDNREVVCAHLANLTPSEFFQPVAVGSGATCGNAVLEPLEECECLEQDKCEGCVNCKLVDPKVVCASSTAHAFVVRHAQTPMYVAVTKALQSSPECCLDSGQMPPSPQTCNNRLDVCSSTTGQCEKACSKYVLRPCGFDLSGCVQQCFHEGRCQGAKLTSQDVPPLPVGMVPNGNACQLPDTGMPGRCTNGVCMGNITIVAVVPSSSTANDALMDLERNELSSSWSGGVKATIVVTEKDQKERCPLFADLLSICPEQLTKEACNDLRCTWCGAKAECYPTAHACNLPNKDEIDRWYLPCQPKI
ncbi:hypothetical protein BASA81_001679 [Batrachochytrium salamandrivorans]|nr:hypothetical protein BASA81_001679 [Batrachochytrium salamandrivorans]